MNSYLFYSQILDFITSPVTVAAIIIRYHMLSEECEPDLGIHPISRLNMMVSIFLSIVITSQLCE